MALPLLLMVPFLFIAGVAFAYFVVMPAALSFLLHFNQHQFNLQIRARDYYGFFSLTMLACGIVFQLPVFILGMVRMGITTPAKLRKNREDLLARHHCRGVRFQVYVKEGKAAIKASAIK